MTGGSGILPQEVCKQRRDASTRQGGLPTNQKRIKWSQEGIDQYNELLKKEAVQESSPESKKELGD